MMRQWGRLLALLLAAMLLCGAAAAEGVVTLPAALTVVPEEMFCLDEAIREVIVPEGVTEIGAGAFSYSGLEQITLPESLEKIGDHAFAYSELKAIALPEGVTQIGEYAFSHTDIERITLPEGLEKLGRSAFLYTNLKEIMLPEGITEIGEYLFSNTDLERITLHDGVRKIGDGAFRHTRIKELTLPDSVTEIGYEAFGWCDLERIVLPDSIELIDPTAFAGCNPDMTAYVSRGSYAWQWCMDNGVQVMSEYGLETPLCSFEFGSQKLGWHITSYDGRYEHVVLPSEYMGERVIYVWDRAFKANDTMKTLTVSEGVGINGAMFGGEMSRLETVNLPASVSFVDRGEFMNCPKLKTVNFAESAKYKTDSTGAVLTKDGDELIFVPRGAVRGALTIPEGVATIGEYALYGCEGITSVSLPDSVTTIEGGAFSRCTSLKSIVIPRGVNVIEGSTFWNCISLRTLTLHKGITSFEISAIDGCSSLQEIDVAEENELYFSIDGVLYTRDLKTLLCCPEGRTGEVSIPGVVEKIGDEAFAGCTKLTKITIPASVKEYGWRAFDRVKAEIVVAEENEFYTTVDGVIFSADRKTLLLFPKDWAGSYAVPEGTEMIAEKAFENCAGLTAVTFPESLKNIGFMGFVNCTSLAEVTIPATMTEFRPWNLAFHGCTSLTAIHVEEGHPNCSSLNGLLLSADGKTLEFIPHGLTGTLVVPGSIKTVETFASDFRAADYSSDDEYAVHAEGFTEIIFEEGVESICYAAFVDHKNLERIVFPASVRIEDPLSWVFVDCAYDDIEYEVAAGSWMHLVLAELYDEGYWIDYSVTGDKGTIRIADGAKIIYDRFLSGSDATAIIVPDGTEEIRSKAFAYCDRLKSVVIPDSVTSIAPDALMGSIKTVVTASGDSYAYQWCLENGVPVMTEDGLVDPLACFTFMCPKIYWYVEGYTGNQEHVVLPTRYMCEDVVGVWDYAFDAHPEMKTLTIPEGYVDLWAIFDGEQTGLTTVNLPASLKRIDPYLFADCPNLTTVNFAEGSVYKTDASGAVLTKDGEELVFMPRGAVKGAYSIPDGVKTIREAAFYECAGMTSVTIPDSVTEIGESAFAYCTGLERVSIPRSVTELDGAFWGCTSLRELTLHEWVTKIDYGTVAGCTSLEAVEVEEGNKHYVSVDGLVYTKDMKKLVVCPPGKTGEVVIPDGVELIGDQAFFDCRKLTKITVPSSVKAYGYDAFLGVDCEIAVDDGNDVYTTVDGVLFTADMKTLIRFPKDWQGIYAVPEGTVAIAEKAFENCSGLTAITFPESLKDIEYAAFSCCTSLETVTIPAGATGFDPRNEVFSGCMGLLNIHVEEGHPSCKSVDGMLLSADGTMLFLVPGGRTGTLVVPDGVTEIYHYAASAYGKYQEGTGFACAEGLTEIVIPEGVTEIYGSAFAGHKNLERVVLPASLDRCDGLVEDIFWDCADATYEVVPGSYAHAWCAYSGENVKLVGDVETVEVSGRYGTIPAGMFEGYQDIREIIVSDDVRRIGARAFAGSGLERITLPNSVREIADDAFMGCDKLTVYVVEGSYAHEWCELHGVSGIVTERPEDEYE